jgi:hypothetical protein
MLAALADVEDLHDQRGVHQSVGCKRMVGPHVDSRVPRAKGQDRLHHSRANVRKQQEGDREECVARGPERSLRIENVHEHVGQTTQQHGRGHRACELEVARH